MEVTEIDYGLGKIIETKSFSKLKIKRDNSSNLILEAICNTDDDFTTQRRNMGSF